MRASLRRLCATIALMACLACGGAPAYTDTLRAEFESPDAGSARSAAPEVMAEADRARALMLAAEDAGDDAAAADERTRARLLLEAAGTQAERVSLEQAQREAEAREEAATVEAVRLETLREQEARALAQDLAGDLARDQARQAFAQAEEDETRRSARNAGPVAAARQRAAQALTLRAQLVLAAAEVMGAAPADVDALRASCAGVADRGRRALPGAHAPRSGTRGAAPGSWRTGQPRGRGARSRLRARGASRRPRRARRGDLHARAASGHGAPESPAGSAARASAWCRRDHPLGGWRPRASSTGSPPASLRRRSARRSSLRADAAHEHRARGHGGAALLRRRRRAAPDALTFARVTGSRWVARRGTSPNH